MIEDCRECGAKCVLRSGVHPEKGRLWWIAPNRMSECKGYHRKNKNICKGEAMKTEGAATLEWNWRQKKNRVS